MNTQTDSQLLVAYAEHRLEPAFAELVRRHLDFVYSAALRMVCDSQIAEDVTQSVFVAFARNAARLASHPVLSGWLHQTTHNIAAQTIRTEVRRRIREQEAVIMNELLTPDASWDRVAPELDAALRELKEADRNALFLRYFEKKSGAEVAACLGISEEAARKRINRGIERLRTYFSKHNVTVGASGLVVLISAHAVQAAPVGLAAAITASAVLAGAAVSSSAALAAVKTIAMSTLQKTLVTAAIAIVAGAGLYQARQATRLREQNQVLLQQQAPLAAKISQLEQDLSRTTNRLASLTADLARAQVNNSELLKLRGIAGVARRATGEAEQLRLQLAHQTSEAGTNLLTGAMVDAMKQAMAQQVEGRLSRLAASLQLTADQTNAIREILRQQAQTMSAGMQQAFSGKFDKNELARLAKEQGDPEARIKALLTPEQLAAYPASQQEEAAHNASLAANAELVQLQTTLDLAPGQLDGVFAALYTLNLNQLTGALKPSASNMVEAMQWMLDQKDKTLEPLLTPAQLNLYRQQLALQVRVQKDILGKLTGTTNAN
ncbi:MAG: sigma-70 family RNA polymerase sigma factor [Verrucomicrobiae bacterium]|nr:sigma-70 family RNA polymerase sigma factor [Verrucomicrobiae bacterium]